MLHRTLALALLLLCAAPALALDETRPEVVAFADEMVAKHGFERAWVDDLLRNAQSQPRIIELMNKPAERVRPWFQYRDHFLTDQRVQQGVDFWMQHRSRLAEVERETGVSAHVIVGILGVETFFGRITGTFRVLDALATLAFDYPSRATYFRGELEQFLLLAREGSVDPREVKGSYAGAMGAPQFMPRSYRAYAVDGGADGIRDLWGSWEDVIGSVANYLKRNGWQPGEPVAVPADLWYPGIDGLVAGSLNTSYTVAGLRDKGLFFDTPLGEDAAAAFISVRGETGPEVRVGFRNFSAITKYNRSVLYALAVHDLGSRIEARLPPAGS
ncbi:MAG: lytic murein transglycosylase B [Steroidobacteraceae bacterium]|nr:lytic murein transglycosylase B [Steroidobacteraceae bacterium]MCC7198911.1 lytic murein transglycosylase B [Gammaproteobacteria bacterium]